MNHDKDTQGAGAHGATVKDPVCGMNVNPGSAFGKYEYGGRAYHFCSADCLEKFPAEPAKYTVLTEPAGPPADKRS